MARRKQSNSRIIGLAHALDTIRKGIRKMKRIIEGRPMTRISVTDYILLCGTVRSVCTAADTCEVSPILYREYLDTYKEYISSVVLPSLTEKHDEFLLRELIKRWSDHKVMTRWLSGIFGFLDRHFIPRMNRFPPLKEIGLIFFREMVCERLHVDVMNAALSLIDQVREGEHLDRSLLKRVMEFFVEMGTFPLDWEYVFETKMFRHNAVYFRQKASDWISDYSFPDPEYIRKAEECFEQERGIISQYLPSSCEDNMLMIADFELFYVYGGQILENIRSCFDALLRNNKVEDLSRIYRLSSKLPGDGEIFVHCLFRQHVDVEATALVNLQREAYEKAGKKGVIGLQEQLCVWELVELLDKVLGYVRDCFQKHSLFYFDVASTFLPIFVGKCFAGRFGEELLAAFCDNILKQGGSIKLSDEAIEATMVKVTKLLAAVFDWDIFAEFYWQKLARRLLYDKCASEECERSSIVKFREKCGVEFTSKMEGTVGDWTRAREHQAIFDEYLKTKSGANPGIDLKVTALARCFWPNYESVDFNLPAELAKCVAIYEEFNRTKPVPLLLTWIHSLGTCTLYGNFEKKTIELIVTTIQAAVLLLFNEADRLSYHDIKSQLNLIDDNEAKRLLYSVSCAKYKILKKEPNGKKVLATDMFEYNSEFTDKKRRIKVSLPSLVERGKVIDQLGRDRHCSLKVSIMKIMKSMEGQAVTFDRISWLCRSLDRLHPSYRPASQFIKSCIRQLIVANHLEEVGVDVYRFLPG